MSTILATSFNITEEYPIFKSVTASNYCGTVTILLDENFTKQMSYELPAVNIDIYTVINGVRTLYKERAIVINTNIEEPNRTYMLLDIPKNCIFAITPLFDKTAFVAHNEMVDVFNSDTKWKTSPGNISAEEYAENDGYILSINEDEKWTTPTAEFTVTLVFDETNIKAGGGSGGDTPTPPTPVDLPPTLYYGTSDNTTISTLEGFNSMSISEETFNVTFNNTNNQYQLFAYESGYNDITSIKADGFDVNILGTFIRSTVTYNGKTYVVLATENKVTFDTNTYIIGF